MVVICTHEACTGCMACVNVCAHKAITIVQDEEGFEHPSIQQNKCVDCGLCKEICPINNPPTLTSPLQVYSGWAKNEDLRLSSSSGGAFSVLAMPGLQRGGVVCGVTLNKDMPAEHIFVETETDLYKLRGSKYVQSRVGDSYKQVKRILLQGREVLFSGTPCQIAGLRNYLHCDYDNLITVDLICHGVPSPKVFDDWKVWFKRSFALKDITKINFRSKKTSWIFFHLAVIGHTKKDEVFGYEGKYYEDAWLRGFLRDYFLRPSCHQCKFTKIERCSDFTIADWWGYSGDSVQDKDYERKGVSLLLCNTTKANALFDKDIKASFEFKERTLEEAKKTNLSLSKPFAIPSTRDAFWKDYHSMDFMDIVKKYMYPERLKLSTRIRIKYRKNSLRDFVLKIVYQLEKYI